MMKFIFSISIVVFGMWGLTACNEGKNNSLTPTQAMGANKGDGTQKVKDKPTDEATARQFFLSGLGQAHQVFGATYKILRQTDTMPRSLFRGILDRLKQHAFQSKGDLTTNFSDCPRYSTLVSAGSTASAASSVFSYTLTERNCGDSAEILDLTIKIENNRYSFTVDPSRWSGALETKGLVDSISCTMVMDGSKKLTDLDCTNFGHGLGEGQFALYKVFSFHSTKPLVLEMEVADYKDHVGSPICSVQKFCHKLSFGQMGAIKVTDVLPEELDSLKAPDLKSTLVTAGSDINRAGVVDEKNEKEDKQIKQTESAKKENQSTTGFETIPLSESEAALPNNL